MVHDKIDVIIKSFYYSVYYNIIHSVVDFFNDNLIFNVFKIIVDVVYSESK